MQVRPSRYSRQGFWLIAGLALLLTLGVAPPAAAQFPLTSCLIDAQGANDEPGQKDLTKHCAQGGTGAFELYTSWNWDLTAVSGGNTADGCTLYDTDADGLANIAICVSVGGSPAGYLSTTLYNCDDTKPDRCSGDSAITPPAGGFSTTCTAVLSDTDPFSAGDGYPTDTQARCSVDTADFGLGGSDARLLDSCSYPSQQPNSDPSDCVIEIPPCTSDAQCSDGNACTTDVCNTSTGFCTYAPASPGTSCEDSAFCTVNDVCNSEGLCQPGPARNCTDGESCTADACNEELDQCTHDAVANGTTCGNAPNGACDAQDVCQAGACIDAIVVAGTECRGSAGVCDVAEACDGINKVCPTDQYLGSATTCRASAGVCDLAEVCSGTSAACPADVFRPNTYVCNEGSECVSSSLCTGSGAECPVNQPAPEGTACGDPTDADCNNPDTCDGAGACQPNIVPAGEVCREAASECDAEELCTAEGTCPADVFQPPGTACGDGTDNFCTDPDTCDGEGLCEPNNEPCGLVTDSSLCEFDIGLGDTCTPGDTSSKQFRLLFTPDAQNWVAYKQNASNPGQFYYNAFVDGTPGSTVRTTISVPWPFVTQGAMPLHVYDGSLVSSTETDVFCFYPPYEAMAAYPATITAENWANGSGNDWVSCPVVTFNPDPVPAYCTVVLDVPIPASGLAYVNLHLDYGTKGPFTDINPVNGEVDRYDRGTSDQWGGADALVNTGDNSGDVAIAECRAHAFSHLLPPGSPGQTSFTDTVYNYNEFKKIAGVFGLVSSAGSGLEGQIVKLMRGSSQMGSATTDADGYYLISYKHTGRAETYTVKHEGTGMTKSVELKANGWAEANFELAPVTATAGGGGQ